jgi:hypothetical protein
MKRVKKMFDREYRHWGITLPEEDLEARLAGEILKAGWMILYKFGRDDDGEYLWVFASHRMTNDRHYRIHESGRITSQPTTDFIIQRPGACPAENRASRRRTRTHNRAVNQMFEKVWGDQMQRASRHVNLLVYLKVRESADRDRDFD